MSFLHLTSFRWSPLEALVSDVGNGDWATAISARTRLLPLSVADSWRGSRRCHNSSSNCPQELIGPQHRYQRSRRHEFVPSGCCNQEHKSLVFGLDIEAVDFSATPCCRMPGAAAVMTSGRVERTVRAVGYIKPTIRRRIALRIFGPTLTWHICYASPVTLDSSFD